MIQTGDVDTAWQTHPRIFGNYKFVGVQAPNGNAQIGKYTVDDQTVKYIYERLQGAINVKFIDATSGSNNAVLATNKFNGATGETVNETVTAAGKVSTQISHFEKLGYQVIANDYPGDSVKFPRPEIPGNYTIKLAHRVAPVVENRIITRRINYLDAKTNATVAPDTVQQAKYQRTAIVDQVTKKVLGYDTDGDGKVNLKPTMADSAWVGVKRQDSWK